MSSQRALVRAGAIWLAALLATHGCTEPSGPSVGGNTNWLDRCEDDAACGSATSCVCGRCSVRCSDDARCGEFAGSTCAGELAARLQCGANEAQRMCLRACRDDGDCATDLACVQGACVEPAQPMLCADDDQALFCSNFDDRELAEWSITAEPNSTLQATESERHAGRSALESEVIAFNGRSRFLGEFTPQRSGTLFLRVWMFVEAGAVLNNVHTVTIGDVDTPDWGVNFLFYQGALAVETPITGPAGDDVAVPSGRWFCLQGEIDLADDGAIRAQLDGAPALSIENIDTLPDAGVHNLTVGIDHLAQPERTRVFFDELLLDTKPTQCTR